MIYFLIAYIVLALWFFKHKTVFFLFMIQTVSIAAGMFIDYHIDIESTKDVVIVSYMIVATALFVVPWKNANGDIMIVANKTKIDKVYKVLSVILGFSFFFLAIAAFSIIIFVGADIDAFKYTDERVEFLYSRLPYDVHFYMLAALGQYFAYIMLPIHFYYLQQRDQKRAIWSFVWSLTIIVHGLTMFSRWTVVLYFLIYFFLFFITRKTYDHTVIKKLRMISAIAFAVILSMFVMISYNRFSQNLQYASNHISPNSKIQDPTLYSFFDYIGQGTPIGYILMQKYDGTTTNFTYATDKLRMLLQYVRIKVADEEKITDNKKSIFKEYYIFFWNLPVYNVYDFGVVLAIVFTLTYSLLLGRGIKKKMNFTSFCKISFWAQLPLLSIFYSNLSIVLLLLVLNYPINVFLKSGTERKYLKNVRSFNS